MTTGYSILGTHMLDLLSRGTSEIATFGNLSNITKVRIYDNNSPDDGYIITKYSSNLGIYKESDYTNVLIGLDSNAKFQVNGSIYTSNIGTYNPDNNLVFNNQNIGGISNIYFTGNLFQNGKAMLTNTATGTNVLVLRRNAYVTSLTQNTFTLTGIGIINIDYSNIDLFINGIKYTYIDALNYDYTFTYTFDGKRTTFIITLVNAVKINDVVDISIWYGNAGANINLSRYSVINTITTKSIIVPVSGNVSILPENIELYINGFRYTYINETQGDFAVISVYDGSFTNFNITLTNYINNNDVIDISLWTGIGNFNFTRYTTVVNDSYSEFVVQADGINTATISNVKLFINGIRYEYINQNNADFTFYYTNDGVNTSYYFTLTNNVNIGDIIDVTVYFGGETGGSGIPTQWGGTKNIYFTAGNVGIGTTNPKYLLHVNGTIGTSNIATYNTDNKLLFNNQNIGGISNIYFTGNIFQNGKSILGSSTATGKNVLVLHQSYIISTASRSTFILNRIGVINVQYNNIDLFINGIKYTYIDSLNYDYTFSTSFDGKYTVVTITLVNSVKLNDIVDISVWYGNAGADLNLFRYSVINNSYTKTLNIPVSGVVSALPENFELFINGFRYTYIDVNTGDFYVSNYYDGAFTRFIISLNNFINVGDVIDVSIWTGVGDFNFARYSAIASSDVSDFSFISSGLSTAVISNIKLFINGIRYEYISINRSDYNFYYTNDGIDTTYYVSLTQSIKANDVIDITIYFGGASGGSSVTSQWAGTNNIYFTAGNVGIGTTNPMYPLDLYGNFRATGNVIAGGSITAFASDRRLKNKVSNILNPIEKIKTLSAFKFTFNDIAKQYGFDGSEVHVGLVAQEVQAILPEIVKPAPFDWDTKTKSSISGMNYLTIQYEKLIPLLVEAIKEQAAQIEVLQNVVFTK